MDSTVDAVQSDDLRLPSGTKVLHIGPPKTGTTALQAAFHLGRESLREQGVHYAGYGPHSATEVHAVLGLPSPWSKDRKPPPIRYWNRLAGEIRSSKARHVVLSAEEFVAADVAAIRRVVADIGGPPVHVVATLRPISQLLPSQWQQNVQNRLTTPFEDWLRETLRRWRAGQSKGFWQRHRHDELVRRWADVVGTDNMSVIVLDGSDRDRLYRAFEALLGLRPGSLASDEAAANRSLTLPEIEAIRAFNVAYRREGLPKPLYTRVMRRGAAPLMERRRPAPAEPRVALPTWSREPIAAAATEIAAGIRATGVRVIGDLDALAFVDMTSPGAAGEVSIDPEIAATLAMGVLVATGAARGTQPVERAGATVTADDEPGAPASTRSELERPYGEAPELFRISTAHLLLVVARRTRAAVLHRLGRIFRPRRRDPQATPRARRRDRQT